LNEIKSEVVFFWFIVFYCVLSFLIISEFTIQLSKINAK
jgi:hypothetical protein